MKILIVGAGIAGISLAAHLKKRGITPYIIEKQARFQERGFVFGIWNNGFKTLSSFHLQREISKISVFPTSFTLSEKKGRLVKYLNIEKTFKKYGYGTFLLRADFHKLLLKLVKKIPIRYGTTVVSITNTKQNVHVVFSDKTCDTFDLVVGADGLHSQIRTLVFGNSYLHYAGITFWVFLPEKRLTGSCQNPKITWHRNQFIGLYPYKGLKACLFLAIKKKKRGFTTNDLINYIRKSYRDFSAYKKLFAGLAKINGISSYHDDMYKVHMPSFIKNRVVLIGDAAHAMLPTTGMGVSMALEDSFVLANLLTRRENIDTSLKEFNRKRKQRLFLVKICTNFIGWLVTEENRIFLFMRNNIVRLFPTPIVFFLLDLIVSKNLE